MVDFGFLTFLHEADYWERSERGDLPAGLTLLMAANALRYVFHHVPISFPFTYLSYSLISSPLQHDKGFDPSGERKPRLPVISPPSL